MTWTEKHEACLQQLTMIIGRGISVDEARKTLTALGVESHLFADVEERYYEILNAVFKGGSDLVLDGVAGTPWYSGPQGYDAFWPRLRDELLGDKKWRDAVPSLDETSTAVLARLGDPSLSAFSKRGLVLGFVQSGKTANFTATIAKAADAGYRLFIVLSGVHNSLRRQTQTRLQQQIVDLNPANWVGLTTEDADFGNPVTALPLVKGSELKLLAVVKKNVTRLTNLVNWLETAQRNGALSSCPILIIDDEADQAGVNTANISKPGSDLDASVIHAHIKRLLNFPKVSYLGYTATPFANVLANPKDAEGIYPRDFIYALPKPKGYFGAEELFGAPLSEDESTTDAEGHNMIRIVSEQEADSYLIPKNGQFSGKVTPALAAAIRWFVMATAARRARSGERDHSSMLVHTTMRVQPQLQMVPVIRKFVKSLTAEWASGSISDWREQWDAEAASESPARHDLRPISFDELIPAVSDVLERVQVVADNSFSEERLIYTDEPATVIAVGGNTLSRGLTLEGLISSFFLRSSTMYDSALQMGRWFGYRRGYSDLPRIWTTSSLARDFRFLSEIESSIREDIARYAREGLTPSQLAVRLLLHPKMQVTSKLKMQYAVPVTASFSSARPQTITFDHLDRQIIESNISAARYLISQNAERGDFESRDANSPIFRDVYVEDILSFLDHYRFHSSSEMAGGLLSEYIQRQVAHGKLTKWNVAVVSRMAKLDEYEDLDLGLTRPVHTIGRSRLVVGDDPADWGGSAYLKAIASTPDFSVDLKEQPASSADLTRVRNEAEVPLLLVYPIASNSKPSNHESLHQLNGEKRVPLNAAGPLIGLAFSLPSAAEGSEPRDMVHVDLGVMDTSLVTDAADEEYYVDNEKTLNEVSLGDW